MREARVAKGVPVNVRRGRTAAPCCEQRSELGLGRREG